MQQQTLEALMPWTEKYRPKHLSELVGNKKAIVELKKWVEEWRKGGKKRKGAALLVGPPGTGKTTAVYALANDMGWDVVEINASDKRNKKEVERILSSSSGTRSLLGEKKLKVILAEEIDGMSGMDDRGGITALVSLIKSARVPFICTANDPTSDRVSKLKKVAKIIEFQAPSIGEVEYLLLRIVNSEGVEIDQELLKEIAEASNGDLRAAINDLQALINLTKGGGEQSSELSSRNFARELEGVLTAVFEAKDYNTALAATEGAPPDYNMLLALFNEHAYKHATDPQSLAQIYEHIALADLYKARIINRQNWKLLRHFYMHLTAGIALVPGIKRKKLKYTFPSYFAKIANARFSLSKFNAIYKRNKDKLHLSYNEYLRYGVPLIRSVLNGKDIELAAELAAFLELKEEEIESIARDNEKLEELLKRTAEKQLEHAVEVLHSPVRSQLSKLWKETLESVTFVEEEGDKKQPEAQEKEKGKKKKSEKRKKKKKETEKGKDQQKKSKQGEKEKEKATEETAQEPSHAMKKKGKETPKSTLTEILAPTAETESAGSEKTTEKKEEQKKQSRKRKKKGMTLDDFMKKKQRG